MRQKMPTMGIVWCNMANFADTFRVAFPREVFIDEDLRLARPELGLNAMNRSVSRSVAAADFIRLKRGVYAFGQRLRNGPISELLIANLLYAPSYVSFETALSYHSVIPEAVRSTTSACFRRKRKRFDTVFGRFTYDYVPCRPFFMGVCSIEVLPSRTLMATPIRALFDLVVERRRDYEDFAAAELDLRLDAELLGQALGETRASALRALARAYRKRRAIDFGEMLIEEFK